jgi:translation elongation factor EF-4
MLHCAGLDCRPPYWHCRCSYLRSLKNRHSMKISATFASLPHIDHRKSTLADRLLGSRAPCGQKAHLSQLLDNMDLEREARHYHPPRIRMRYLQGITLNLIVRPAVDFSYEVGSMLRRGPADCGRLAGVRARRFSSLYLAVALIWKSFRLSIKSTCCAMPRR